MTRESDAADLMERLARAREAERRAKLAHLEALRQREAAGAERLKAARERAVRLTDKRDALGSLDRLATFVQWTWPDMVPDAPQVTWGWHMEAICDEIQALLEEADRRRARFEAIREECEHDADRAERMVAAELATLPRLWLVVMVPPRHSKSIIVQRAVPAWRWLHRPQEQFLTLASSDKLVERDGLRLRDLITSERYQRLQRLQVQRGGASRTWGLRQDQNAKSKFDTTEGGTRQGYALGSRFTGVDADINIIDDPHDVNEILKASPAAQEREMLKVRDTFTSKIQDRPNNPLWAVSILIMQRLHPDDLAGWMAEQGARVVCLPSEYDPDHAHVYDKDRRTEPGEPLNPLRFPKAELERRRREDPHYSAKHGQDPKPPGGDKVREEWLEGRYDGDPVDVAQTCEAVWFTSDPNQKGGAGHDDSGLAVLGFRDGEVLFLDFERASLDWPSYEARCIDMIERWLPFLRGSGQAVIEDTVNGAVFHQVHGPVYKGVNLYKFHPSSDTPGRDKSKDARAVYVVRAASAGRFKFPRGRSWVPDLRRMLAGYPMRGRDVMDTVSQAVMLWDTREAGAAPGPTAEDMGAFLKAFR